jgi:hypothetical protein
MGPRGLGDSRVSPLEHSAASSRAFFPLVRREYALQPERTNPAHRSVFPDRAGPSFEGVPGERSRDSRWSKAKTRE